MTLQSKATADIIRRGCNYRYEADRAVVERGVVRASVRRCKDWPDGRRFYGEPREVCWPLADVRVEWRDQWAAQT